MSTEEKKQPNPIRNEEEVAQNPDQQIDKDFPNFPHAPSSNEMIDPKSENEKKTADINRRPPTAVNEDKMFEDDGSANAFERTESGGGYDDNDGRGLDMK